MTSTVLDSFIKKWEEDAIIFYTKLREQKMALIKRSCDAWNNKEGKLAIKEAEDNFTFFEGTISQKVFSLLTDYGLDGMIKLIKKEAQAKKCHFIKIVEKKGGKIQSLDHLSIGDDGSINGYASCKNHNVRIATIWAGGYNIQCLHYRLLTNIIK